MVSKKTEKLSNLNKEYPKFAESMVQIMDIIEHKGGINEVTKNTSVKREFSSKNLVFSEMDRNKSKTKKTISE